jgi:hypothetical protein
MITLPPPVTVTPAAASASAAAAPDALLELPGSSVGSVGPSPPSAVTAALFAKAVPLMPDAPSNLAVLSSLPPLPPAPAGAHAGSQSIRAPAAAAAARAEMPLNGFLREFAPEPGTEHGSDDAAEEGMPPCDPVACAHAMLPDPARCMDPAPELCNPRGKGDKGPTLARPPSSPYAPLSPPSSPPSPPPLLPPVHPSPAELSGG